MGAVLVLICPKQNTKSCFGSEGAIWVLRELFWSLILVLFWPVSKSNFFGCVLLLVFYTSVVVQDTA